MNFLSYENRVKIEGGIMDELSPSDSIEYKENERQKEVLIRHNVLGGITLYIIFLLFIAYLYFAYNLDILTIIILLIIGLLPAIGAFSQKIYIIGDIGNGSITVHKKAILKEEIFVFRKEEAYLKLFKFPRWDKTIPERVTLAIASDESGKKFVLLNFLRPFFLFDVYSLEGDQNSYVAKFKTDEIQTLVTFLELPLSHEVGTLDPFRSKENVIKIV